MSKKKQKRYKPEFKKPSCQWHGVSLLNAPQGKGEGGYGSDTG